MNDKKPMLLLPPSSGTIKLPEEMIVKDFENIYKVLLAYMKEKNIASKLSLLILSVPYLVSIALVTVKVFPPDKFTDFRNLPEIIQWLALVCGIFGVVPLYRFIELTDDQMRCTRNN